MELKHTFLSISLLTYLFNGKYFMTKQNHLPPHFPMVFEKSANAKRKKEVSNYRNENEKEQEGSQR